MTGDTLRELASFAAKAEIRRMPAEIVDKAKACLLYGLAVAIASIRAEQPAQAARAIGDEDHGPATRFFDDRNCAPDRAAFANGALFHARVQEDAHPAGHVGVVVIPAALALAESARASGGDLLAALVAGYEIALRVGRDHAADLSARGFRTTPAYGVFGAAAASAHLLLLDAERTAHALALAANMAGGLRAFVESGTGEFAFQAGWAAANGILAARLAAEGAIAGPSALEGSAGFLRAFGEDGRRYDARLTEGLGRIFEMRTITYKPYPICQFHRGIVHGSIALRERARAPLEAMTVRMHPFEADFLGVRYAGPFTAFPQTFMSAPFCAALAWARGNATFAGLNDFAAADVLALVPRVAIVAETGRARYTPAIEAHLADDTVLRWEEHEGSDAYALTWDAACDMTSGLCAEAGVSARHATRLIDAVSRLDSAPGIDAVIAAMRAGCEAARMQH